MRVRPLIPAVLLSIFVVPVGELRAADGLNWNRVAGSESAAESSAAKNKPVDEWSCRPASSGEGWACIGGNDPAVPVTLSETQLDEVPPEDPLAPDLPASLFVLREDLPADVQARLPNYCYGEYQLPAFPYPPDTDDSLYPVISEADRIEAQLDQSMTMEGDVRFAQGNRTVRSKRAHYDMEKRTATLEGGVRVVEPTMVLQSEHAAVEVDASAVELSNAQFLLVESSYRGKSNKIIRSDAGDLELRGNRLTRCEPGDNGWQLDAKKVTITEGEVFGTARGAVLRMKDVPVFYTPWIQFPVSDDRQSGFLFPAIGYGSEDGLDLAAPYYLNLAPNYDATLVPRFLSKRGAALEGEFRYLSHSQEVILSGGYLPDDDLYNGDFTRKDFNELFPGQRFKPADRSLTHVEQKGQFGPVSSRIDYTSVSDRDYFRDLGSDFAMSSEIQIEKRGELFYNFRGASFRLWAQDFQRLDEVAVDPYRRLPELVVDWSKYLGPLLLTVNAQGASFDRKTENLSGIDTLTGERYHVEPKLTLPFNWPFGHLKFTAGYSSSQYDLKQEMNAPGVRVDDLSPDRHLGTGSVDGGLIFERDLTFRGTELTQTLEPRVFYLYRNYVNQNQFPLFDTGEYAFSYSQVFREDRFGGLDRKDDANQLAVGVTTRFLDRGTGTEYLRMSIGQIKYFDDRRVSLYGLPADDLEHGASELASEVEARIAKHWWLGGGAVWDPHDNEFDEASAFIQYRRENQRILNLGFRRRVIENIKQTDFSLYWPLSRYYSMMVRWNYDLVSDRTVEAFAGIEYNNCCLQVRVMARRFLESPAGFVNFVNVRPEKGIFLQFVFKGLAGFGTRVESVLTRGIRGYYTDAQPGYLEW